MGDEEFALRFTVDDGLGPVFVATGCEQCHVGDGKGHPIFNFTRFGASGRAASILLTRLGRPQLQHRSVPGYPPEVIPPEATGVSVFTAPAVTGLGYLDAVDDATLIALTDEHGPLDVVIFAHGVLPDQLASERSGGEAARSLQTNLTGTVSAMVPLASQMAERGQGTLVVLSTVAARRPLRDNCTYGAGKAGLEAFARGFGGALEELGVGVLIVRLGFVHMRMTEGMAPAPLASTPDVVAARVARVVGHPGASVLYAPPLIRVLAAVLRLLPQPLLDHMARGRMPD